MLRRFLLSFVITGLCTIAVFCTAKNDTLLAIVLALVLWWGVNRFFHAIS